MSMSALIVPHWINSNLHLFCHVCNLSLTKSWFTDSLIMHKFLTFRVSMSSLRDDGMDFSVEIHHFCCCVSGILQSCGCFSSCRHSFTHWPTWIGVIKMSHIFTKWRFSSKVWLLKFDWWLFIITVIINYVNVILLLPSVLLVFFSHKFNIKV